MLNTSFVCIYIHTYIYIYAYIYVSVCVCMHACMYEHIYNIYIHLIFFFGVQRQIFLVLGARR